VAIFGDRRIKRMLRRALRWEVMPFPKHKQVCETTSAGLDYTLGEIPNSGPDAVHVV
jgi:hypothetical protein